MVLSLIPISSSSGASPLSAAFVGDGFVYETCSGTSGTTVGSMTVLASGGVAPYTYAWTDDAGGPAISATTPTATSTTFDWATSYDASANTTTTITDSVGSVVSLYGFVYVYRTDIVPP